MANHTPGPWIVGGTFMPDSDDPRQNVWGPTPKGEQSGRIVAQNCRPPDARLIAAAPELLAACEAFVMAWEKCLQLEKTDVALRLAKAAIAKARQPLNNPE